MPLGTKTHHTQSQVLQKNPVVQIANLDLSLHTLKVNKEATGRLSALRVMARSVHPVTDLLEHPAIAPSVVQVADTLVVEAGVEENGVEANGPK
jgi:hypothetical protein